MHFKTKKHEAFHSLTVTVFCRVGYWKCHTLKGVDDTVNENEHDLLFALFLQKLIKKNHMGKR